MTPGLYVPGTTVVHRAPAGSKLLVLTAVGTLVFAVPTAAVAAGALLAVLVVGVGLAQLPPDVLGRQARLLVWWLLALVIAHALVGDAQAGVTAAVRLLALVLAAAVVTSTTRVTELVAVVERVCWPLRLFGVRTGRIGLVVAMALRFIPVLADRAGRIREAMAARGGSVRGVRGVVTLAVPLLVSVLRMAHAVGEALDARGADDTDRPRRQSRPEPAA